MHVVGRGEGGYDIICLFKVMVSRHYYKTAIEEEGFPGGAVVKICLPKQERLGFSPCSMKWQPTPVLLPEEFHGQRHLVGYSPRHHKELDTTD